MKKVIIPGLVAGVLMLVASLVFGMITSSVFPSLMTEYSNPALFRSWSDPLMYYMYLHPIVMGLLLSFVWYKANTLIKEKDPVKKGILFATYVWVIFTIPGMLISWSSFPISLLMVVTWALSALIQYAVAGVVFAYMSKK